MLLGFPLFESFLLWIDQKRKLPRWSVILSLKKINNSCLDFSLKTHYCSLRWMFYNRKSSVSQRSWVQIPYRPEFFSGLIFTTSQVVFLRSSFIYSQSFNSFVVFLNLEKNALNKARSILGCSCDRIIHELNNPRASR